jgi:hypothetical protein
MWWTIGVFVMCILGVAVFCFCSWGGNSDWANAVNRARQEGVDPPDPQDLPARNRFLRTYDR